MGADQGVNMESGEAYQELRPLLFSIAYRMVGSVSEAEDIVQETFLRFHRAVRAGAQVESPKAYLSTVTTRLAVNHLRSARVRRGRYVGTWLPEPLLTDSTDDAAQHAETADSVSMACLVLLESLAVLRGGRGRRHRGAGGRAGRRRGDVRRRRRQGASGRQADPRPPAGRSLPARAGSAGTAAGVHLRVAAINGQPGALAFDPRGRLVAALSLDIAGGQVQTVRSVVNPDKLRHLGPVGD
jgi:RNA polymerase sigma-70 factor (ECF subfamily)